MKTQEFTTREDADEARDKAIVRLGKCETIGGVFCPLINGACVPTCVCFGKPHVGNSGGVYDGPSPTTWYLYGHYCTNEMFFKEEYNVNCNNNY